MNVNIITKHKQLCDYCTNCGIDGHNYRECELPRTSYGLIVVKLPHYLKNILHKQTKSINIYTEQLRLSNNDDIIISDKIKNDIEFVMVSRRHSLGFSEFIRGRYKLGNVNEINYLFKQMQEYEIESIKNNNFEYLVNEYWNDDVPISLKNDYISSKAKFDVLKQDMELLNSMKSLYKTPEWGFPKGGMDKVNRESGLQCALREFNEETGIPLSNIKLYNIVNPIEEIMYGTDGITYRNVYYLAEIVNYSELNIESPSNEIGEVKFVKFNEALKIIREYHPEKKKILKHIHSLYSKYYIKHKRTQKTQQLSLLAVS